MRAVQTIEKTSKTWKGLMVLAVLIMGAGMVFVAVALNGASAAWVFASILLLGGFVVYLVARIGAWWYHG